MLAGDLLYVVMLFEQLEFQQGEADFYLLLSTVGNLV